MKNYIRKIVKEVLAEKETDQLFSDRETVRVIIKEFIIPGVKSMVGEYLDSIKISRAISNNALSQSGEAKEMAQKLERKIDGLQAKLDGDVGKEVLKRLLG